MKSSKKERTKKPRVGIVMGSDSDLPVMEETATLLQQFQIPYEMRVISAHRTPALMVEYASSAQDRGLEVIIAGAGAAAGLPGMIASLTCLPVVGVPIKGSALNGLDALFSIVQMPTGVPVATVAINGAKNAGILAAEIIGIKDPQIQKQLGQHRRSMEAGVRKKSIQKSWLG